MLRKLRALGVLFAATLVSASCGQAIQGEAVDINDTGVVDVNSEAANKWRPEENGIQRAHVPLTDLNEFTIIPDMPPEVPFTFNACDLSETTIQAMGVTPSTERQNSGHPTSFSLCSWMFPVEHYRLGHGYFIGFDDFRYWPRLISDAKHKFENGVANWTFDYEEIRINQNLAVIERQWEVTSPEDQPQPNKCKITILLRDITMTVDIDVRADPVEMDDICQTTIDTALIVLANDIPDEQNVMVP